VATVVETSALTKDYDVGFWRKRKVRALDGLSLSVSGGEIFGFLGANGAGKTTTLKLLMRLIYPTSGSAQILGRDIGDVSVHRHIGYLPENPYFYDYLSAREFVDYCGQLFGYASSERRRRTNTLLERVRLDPKRWDLHLRRFSKGMLQRVGLAQALVNDPKVVFLDEPMSGLDPVGRREVRDLINELRSEGKTVFMCSHILSDIEVLCDRVAIVKRGRVAHSGSIEELRQRADNASSVEVVTSGADATILKSQLTRPEFQIAATPGGVRVTVPDEALVDDVLVALRKTGGKLVSVQPVRQTLEDLFVNES
jgi:ABC-2 type transport system ATP-binding protein